MRLKRAPDLQRQAQQPEKAEPIIRKSGCVLEKMCEGIRVLAELVAIDDPGVVTNQPPLSGKDSVLGQRRPLSADHPHRIAERRHDEQHAVLRMPLICPAHLFQSNLLKLKAEWPRRTQLNEDRLSEHQEIFSQECAFTVAGSFGSKLISKNSADSSARPT
jgi:hypothetical protein